MEKYLVFALECLELNPSVKMYDLLMTKFLKEKFQAEIPNLVTKWTQQCWSCFKVAGPDQELKTCTECKMAKYCDRECQKSEWKLHKLLHKELELTQQVLEERED